MLSASLCHSLVTAATRLPAGRKASPCFVLCPSSFLFTPIFFPPAFYSLNMCEAGAKSRWGSTCPQGCLPRVQCLSHSRRCSWQWHPCSLSHPVAGPRTHWFWAASDRAGGGGEQGAWMTRDWEWAKDETNKTSILLMLIFILKTVIAGFITIFSYVCIMYFDYMHFLSPWLLPYSCWSLFFPNFHFPPPPGAPSSHLASGYITE